METYYTRKEEAKFDQEDALLRGVLSDALKIFKLMREEPTKMYIYTAADGKWKTTEKEHLVDEYKLLTKAKNNILKELNIEIEVFKETDKNIYDPTNKAKRALPLRPAIFIEVGL